MPSLNKPVQTLKVAILALDLLCSGPVTHSGEILTTGKSQKYMTRTAGHTWTDYKTNAQIAKELKITPIFDKLLEYKRN